MWLPGALCVWASVSEAQSRPFLLPGLQSSGPLQMCAASHLARLQLATQPLLQHSSEQSPFAAHCKTGSCNRHSTQYINPSNAICVTLAIKEVLCCTTINCQGTAQQACDVRASSALAAEQSPRIQRASELQQIALRCTRFLISSGPCPLHKLCMLHCRWLVGISYRVMFRRDPIPAQSTAQTSVLKHVHGAVYICGDSMRPGCQPKADLAKADLGDHSAQAYMGALSSNCKRQSDREQASGTYLYTPKVSEINGCLNQLEGRALASAVYCCLTDH